MNEIYPLPNYCFARNCPTVCVSGGWAGVDSAWEQRKLEARKMPENAAESPASSAPKKMGESHHFIQENVILFRQKRGKVAVFSKKGAIFTVFK
jgi:hypothetical protein